MRLYDLRVTVERIEGRSVCGLEVGDYFEVTESSRVRIPDGKHFCLFAMQSVLPLLPAKMRRLAGRGLARAGLARRLPRSRRAARHAHRADRRAHARHRGADVARELGIGLRTDQEPATYEAIARRAEDAGIDVDLGLPRPALPAGDRAAPAHGTRDGADPPRPGRAQPVHAASVRDRRSDRDARRGLGRTRVPRSREGRLARSARDRGGAAAGARCARRSRSSRRSSPATRPASTASASRSSPAPSSRTRACATRCRSSSARGGVRQRAGRGRSRTR